MTDEMPMLWAILGQLSRISPESSSERDAEKPRVQLPCPSCQGLGYLLGSTVVDWCCYVQEVTSRCESCLGTGLLSIS
jgi:hypothetical protein